MSPRIAVLEQRLESGDRRALDEFWSEAKRSGTPLIEPANGDLHEVIVTFIWRGDRGTQSVGLLAPLAKSPGMPSFPLDRLLRSDAWYKSWQMRDDLRFTYRFLPNVKSSDEQSQQNAKVDPLNAHRIEVSYDDGATTTEFSIAAMRYASDESWIVAQSNVPSDCCGSRVTVVLNPGQHFSAHERYKGRVVPQFRHAGLSRIVDNCRRPQYGWFGGGVCCPASPRPVPQFTSQGHSQTAMAMLDGSGSRANIK